MKKAISLILAALFVGAMVVTAAAMGGDTLSDWKNLPGYTYYMFEKDGKRHPVQLSQNNQGVNIKCDGFYEVNTKEYSGIILKEAVVVDGFTLEFTINTPGGNSDDGDDCWLGIGLLDKPNCFDVYNPNQAAGFVNLIRPNTKDCNVQLYEYTHDANDFNSTVKYTLDDKTVSPKGKTKIQIKQNADKSYSYYVNGNKIIAPLRKLDALYSKSDGQAYLYIGTSTNSGNTWDVTINSINGKSLAGGGTVVSSASGAKTSSVSLSSKSPVVSSTPVTNDSTTSTDFINIESNNVSVSTSAEDSDVSDTDSQVPDIEDSTPDSSVSEDTSSVPEDIQTNGENGSNAWIWIVVAVVIVLGGSVALYFVKFKKK